MSDITPPTPPPSDASTPPATSAAPAPSGNAATSTGLEPNIAAGIAAVFGWIGGLIFFFVEKKSTFVRFWAAQLAVLWLGVVAVMIALSIVSMILSQISNLFAILFGLISLVIWLGCFVMWVITLIKTFGGKEWRIPFVADLADKLVAKFPAGA